MECRERDELCHNPQSRNYAKPIRLICTPRQIPSNICRERLFWICFGKVTPIRFRLRNAQNVGQETSRSPVRGTFANIIQASKFLICPGAAQLPDRSRRWNVHTCAKPRNRRDPHLRLQARQKRDGLEVRHVKLSRGCFTDMHWADRIKALSRPPW